MAEFEYPSPEILTTDDLKAYMDTHHEKKYMLIDVRQPAEYQMAHIPGARILPLLEFESRLFDLPPDKDLIFYCRSGSRSMAAAALTMDAEVTSGTVYNLDGGIMEWYGKTLPDFPKVQLFDQTNELADRLYMAMELEKGAWRFYHHILQLYPSKPFTPIFETLSKAETGHAKAVYGFWKPLRKDPPPFDTLFANLPGNILEGGQPIEAMLNRVDALDGDVCLNLIEISLDIEYAAFDLYRPMAHQATESESHDAFTAIAQAEKGHMKVLANATTHCQIG